MKKQRLLLKWGTMKGWDFGENRSPELDAALNKMDEHGQSISCMAQDRSGPHNDILCEIIDAMDDDARFFNDWSGEEYTKEEAKKYVREYGVS